MHHRTLKGFAAAQAALWNLAARRTAWQGLAVLASMLRRLICLMAKEIPLARLLPRDTRLPQLASAAPPPSRPPPLRTPARAIPLRAEPVRVPETPAFKHARLLDRLAVLAEVYRARARLGRGLARRVQSGRAPLRLYTRKPRGFTDLLDHLGARLAAPDTS